MKIRELNPTADVAFQVVTRTGVESINFTVRFLGRNEMPDFIPAVAEGGKPRASRLISEALVDAVESWDISQETPEGEQPLPCTPENKRKYFPQLLALQVSMMNGKPADGKVLDDVLGVALVNFAGDPENFVKN
jgi:hypothetical protein